MPECQAYRVASLSVLLWSCRVRKEGANPILEKGGLPEVQRQERGNHGIRSWNWALLCAAWPEDTCPPALPMPSNLRKVVILSDKSVGLQAEGATLLLLKEDLNHVAF